MEIYLTHFAVTHDTELEMDIEVDEEMITKLKAALADAKRTIAGILLPKVDGCVPWNQIVDLRIVRIKKLKRVPIASSRVLHFVSTVD